MAPDLMTRGGVGVGGGGTAQQETNNKMVKPNQYFQSQQFTGPVPETNIIRGEMMAIVQFSNDAQGELRLCHGVGVGLGGVGVGGRGMVLKKTRKR